MVGSGRDHFAVRPIGGLIADYSTSTPTALTLSHRFGPWAVNQASHTHCTVRLSYLEGGLN